MSRRVGFRHAGQARRLLLRIPCQQRHAPATAGLTGRTRGWQLVIPPAAIAGGVAAAVVIGATAGLYPAMRAARLAPTEALRAV